MNLSIREYAAWLDQAAPPLERLIPDFQRASDGPPVPESPKWWIGVAAFVAIVVAVLVPTLLMNGPAEDPVSVVGEGPRVMLLRSGNAIRGAGFSPGAALTLTLEEGETISLGAADEEGAFEASLTVLRPDHAYLHGDQFEVSDGTNTARIHFADLYVSHVDPVRDTVSGWVSLPGDGEIHVVVTRGSEEIDVPVTPEDGDFLVDLRGVFDVTLNSTATLYVDQRQGSLSSWPTAAVPALGYLEFDWGAATLVGERLPPNTALQISIDGSALVAPVTTDAGGRFAVDLTEVGVEVTSGEVVLLQGDEVNREIVARRLAILTREGSLMRGVGDFPDGEVVSVYVGSGRLWYELSATVQGGVWELLLPAKLDNLSLYGWVSVADEDGDLLKYAFNDLP